MNNNIGPIFWLVLFGGIGVLVLVYLIIYIYKNASAPKISLRARVVEKRIYIDTNSSPEIRGGTKSYSVTFEDGNGVRRKFTVKRSVYDQLTEEETGLLACQGTWFKGFARETDSFK